MRQIWNHEIECECAYAMLMRKELRYRIQEMVKSPKASAKRIIFEIPKHNFVVEAENFLYVNRGLAEIKFETFLNNTFLG